MNISSLGGLTEAKDSINVVTRRGLVLPFIALLALTAAIVGVLLFVAARGQDRIAADRSVALVRAMLADHLRDLTRTVRDYAWWGDAYNNLVVKPDPTWASDNIGPYLFSSFDITGSFVVDEHGATAFAFEAGRAVAFDLLGHAGGGLDQLLAQARANPTAPQPANGLITVDGKLQMAAASAVLNGQPTPATVSARSVLVFLKEVDRPWLDSLAHDIELPDLKLDSAGSTPGSPSLAVETADGKLFGWLSWHADQPGRAMLRSLVLPLGGSVVVLALLCAVLIRRALALLRRDGELQRRSQRSLRLQAATLNAAQEGIATFDAQLRLVAWNEAYAAMYRLPPELLYEGAPLERLIHYRAERGDYDPQPRDEMIAKILGTVAMGITVESRLYDGRTIEITRLPLPGGGYVASSRDITDSKNAERSIVAARNQAEAATEAKSQFLAMMSHEIRTPLNGIVGFAELLAEADLPAPEREQARIIRDAGQTLLVIINDILDFSKIEAGKVSLERIEFSLSQALRSCIALNEVPARAHGLALDLFTDPGLPEWVFGDPTRLRQVLTNLLGNAVKFTAEGGVTVHLSAGRRPDGDELIRFEVADTGIGIAPEKQSQMFEQFTQAEPTTTRQYGGTGLGLAICRSLVSLMGGEIGVESSPGHGSTFWFTANLPAAGPPQPAAVAQDAAPGAPPRRLRILVADDIEINQMLARILLQRAGHEVTVVADGIAAVTAAQREQFDLILMDVHMPHLDGLDATRAIRVLPGPAGRVPIIALTASVFSTEIEKCRSAGMNGHLAKPMHKAQLMEILARVHKGRGEN